MNTVDGAVTTENQDGHSSDNITPTPVSSADSGNRVVVDNDAHIGNTNHVFEDTGSPSDAVVVEEAVVDVVDAEQSGEQGLDCLWQETFPTLGSKNLHALWGSAQDDIYAVGDSGTVFHYDGSQWNRVNTDTVVDLLDIWGSGKDDIYIVGGTYERNYGYKGYVLLHFDGKDWNKVEIVFPSDSCELRAVFGTSPNNVFVAGNCKALWHFDGSSWRDVSPPEPSYLDWSDIFSCGGEEVYAVNNNGGGIYRYNPDISQFEIENRWNLQIGNPNYGNLQYRVLRGTAVCVSPDDLWMARDDFLYDSETNGIFHWNGQRWTALEVEALETAGQKFREIYISPDGERYLIGDDGAMFWFNGALWQSVDTATRLKLNNIFSIDGSRLFVVGDLGIMLDGTIDHFDNLSQGVETPFLSLLKWDSDKLAAITTGGDVVLGNGDGWKNFTNDNAADFTAHAATKLGEDQILIGGSYSDFTLGIPTLQPGLFKFEDGRIESASMNINVDYVGVQCGEIRGFLPIDDELYTVCDNGDVLRRDGDIWRSVASNSSCSMNVEATNWFISDISMWGDASNNIFVWGIGTFAVGSSPNVHPFACRYDGTIWKEIPLDQINSYDLASSASAKAIWGSFGDIYILYMSHNENNQLDICGISIRRFDGTNTILAAGCSPEAEVVFDPDSNEFAFSGPEDGFFISLYDSGISYKNSSWTIIPYGFETSGNIDSKPVVSFLETQLYAVSEGSIYLRDCDL